MELDPAVKRILDTSRVNITFKWESEARKYSVYSEKYKEHNRELLFDNVDYSNSLYAEILQKFSERGEDVFIHNTYGGENLYIPGKNWLDVYNICSDSREGQSLERYCALFIPYETVITEFSVIGYRLYKCHRFLPIVIKSEDYRSGTVPDEVLIVTRQNKVEKCFPASDDEVVKKAYLMTRLHLLPKMYVRSSGKFILPLYFSTANSDLSYDGRGMLDLHKDMKLAFHDRPLLTEFVCASHKEYISNYKPRKRKKADRAISEDDKEEILLRVKELRNDLLTGRHPMYYACMYRHNDNLVMFSTRVTWIYNLTHGKRYAFNSLGDTCVFNPGASLYGEVRLIGEPSNIFRDTPMEHAIPVNNISEVCKSVPWSYINHMIFVKVPDDRCKITRAIAEHGLKYLAAVSSNERDFFTLESEKPKSAFGLSKKQLKELEDKIAVIALEIDIEGEYRNELHYKTSNIFSNLYHIHEVLDQNMCVLDNCTWGKVFDIVISTHSQYCLRSIFTRAMIRTSSVKDAVELLWKFRYYFEELSAYLTDRERIQSQHASELGFDIRMFPDFPPVDRIHRLTVEIQNLYARIQIRDAIKRYENENSEYKRNVLPNYRKLNYRNDRYVIYVPENITDLVVEGKVQGHCLEHYTTSVSSGNEVILFMRRSESEEEPFLDIDVDIRNGMQVRQIHGKSNSNISDYEDSKEILSTLSEWGNINKIQGCTESKYFTLGAIA